MNKLDWLCLSCIFIILVGGILAITGALFDVLSFAWIGYGIILTGFIGRLSIALLTCNKDS
jgi:hypothetical protein